MTLGTAITIATNSDNLEISTVQNKVTNKYCVILYLLRDGKIHTPLLSTEYVFDLEVRAYNFMCDKIVEAKEYIKEINNKENNNEQTENNN